MLNKRGFTLIELILLTVILAVLVGVSTPLFSKTFSSLRLRDDSYNLAKLINYIQEKSVIEGRIYKLVLDAEKKRYYVMVSDSTDPKKYTRLDEKAGKIFHLSDQVSIKARKSEILFYPDGHSDKAAIVLSNRKDKTVLNITGNMGYVEFEEKKGL
jgi:Tfp pilus assembly protein FimT